MSDFEKFMEKMDECDSAVQEADPLTRKLFSKVYDVFLDTLEASQHIEEDLANGCVSDYEIDGDEPLNLFFKEAREQHTMIMEQFMHTCLMKENVSNFPNNLAQSINEITADEYGHTLSPEMKGHVQNYNEIARKKAPLEIERGMSVLENQFTNLMIKDFSKRLNTLLNNQPELSLVIDPMQYH